MLQPDELDLALANGKQVQGLISATSVYLQNSWPFVLIELRLSVIEVRPRPNYNTLPEALVRRGLTRVRTISEPAEPPDRPRWTVRMPRRGREDGVFAPAHGDPRGWKVITPLPQVPPAFETLVDYRRGRCGIFLTTKTSHLTWITDFEQAGAELLKVAEGGDVFSTVAVVVP